VTNEILPAIRKHGGYLTPKTVEEALLSPDTIIRLATDLKREQESRRAAEAERARLEIANQQIADQFAGHCNTKIINKVYLHIADAPEFLLEQSKGKKKH
jgi:prophage antirepressor-like protein